MCASFCVPAPSEEVLLCHFGAAAGSSSAKVSTVHISRPAKQFEVQSASTPFGVYVKVCQQLLTPPPVPFPSLKMLGRGLALAALAAVLALGSAKRSFTSLMFQVEPKTEDCVHEDLKAGSEVDAQLLVTRGGKLDVRFRVRHPRCQAARIHAVPPHNGADVCRLRTPIKQSSMSSCSSPTSTTAPARFCPPS